MKIEGINGNLIVRDNNDKLMYILPLNLLIVRSVGNELHFQTLSNYNNQNIAISNKEVISINGTAWDSTTKTIDDLFKEILKEYE